MVSGRSVLPDHDPAEARLFCRARTSDTQCIDAWVTMTETIRYQEQHPEGVAVPSFLIRVPAPHGTGASVRGTDRGEVEAHQPGLHLGVVWVDRALALPSVRATFNSDRHRHRKSMVSGRSVPGADAARDPGPGSGTI